MKKSIIAASLLTTALLMSCKEQKKEVVSAVKEVKTLIQEVKGSDFSLTKKWELTGFKMPESVFASANHDWLYVSNVNGPAPGFISKVSKDGVVEKLEWVTGLMAPTGSDMYQNKLYVADVKKLHVIDVATGTIEKSYEAKNAASLNDVAIHQATGQVFISDVPGGKVYTLKDHKLVVFLDVPEIPFPNGVYVRNNALIVANYGLKNGEGLMRKQWKPQDFGSIYKVDIATKKMEIIKSTEKKGVYDGVVEINGVLLASSNPTGQLFTFDGDKSYLIDASAKGIADINTDGEFIYAPYLFNNKLVAFQKVAWDRVTTKAEYLEKGADNYYGDADGTSVATSDGIIKGKFSGMELKGTWDWQDDFFCRTSTIGTIDLGSDCIQIDVTDTKMRLVLNQGKGPSVVYDKKNRDQEITILSTFKIKEDQIALYKKEMLGNQDKVRQEDGTLEMKLFQDQKNPTNFIVFGINKSEETLKSHSAEVEERGIADRVKIALAEAPKTLFLKNQHPISPIDLIDFKEIKTEADDVLLFFMFDIKEGYGDKLVAQLKKHTELTRKEKGNVRFDFYKLNGTNNTYVIQEHWQNEAAGAIHRKQSYTKETEVLMKEAIGNLKQEVYFVNQIEK